MCKMCSPSKRKRVHKCVLCGNRAPNFPGEYILHGNSAYPVCREDANKMATAKNEVIE